MKFNARYIEQWLAERGLSQAWMARQLGIPPQHLNRWMKGRTEPKAGNAAELAALMGVGMAQLYIDDGPGVAEDRAKYTAEIPIVGMVGAAAADVPLYTDGDYPAGTGLDTVRIPLDDPECFALTVRGDSMEPIYFDGTTVVMTPRVSYVRGGSLIRPIINGRAYYVRDTTERRYIKLVRRLNGTYILSSSNSAYDPIVLPTTEVIDIFGIVLSIQPTH